MSQILEQLNAEQERLEQEQMQSQLKNCCNELKSEMLQMKKELQQDMMLNNLLRIKDMRDFIYSNPTLKSDNIKELVFQRYLEIYKTNHASEVSVKFDHDNNPNTEEILMEQAIDLLVQEL